MKFLLYAHPGQSEMETHLGVTACRNEIMLRAFADVLATLGEIVRLDDPAEADALYRASREQGGDCLLLSFASPQDTFLGNHDCPVIPVFAWGYPDIPEWISEVRWRQNPLNDWRTVFQRTGRAITMSSQACDAVQRSMGSRFPVECIPVPIHPAYERSAGHTASIADDGVPLRLRASVADSHRMGLNVDSLIVVENDDGTDFHPDDLIRLPIDSRQARSSAVPPADDNIETDETETTHQTPWMPPVVCDWEPPAILPIFMRLNGVIYSSVMTPSVDRKNVHDIVSAFCWIFRDTEDATLVLKLEGIDLRWQHQQLLMLLSKLSPLKCRVIAISGELSADDYADLVAVSHFYVNASLCEDICLPLLDFLNEGVPALAPDHTAMADCIDESIAFVVKSYPGEPAFWPHGDHDIARTTRHQIDWQSLAEAYRLSHEVIRKDASRYQRMSRCAAQSVQAYCGPDVVREQLRAYLCPHLVAAPTQPQHAASAPFPQAAP